MYTKKIVFFIPLLLGLIFPVCAQKVISGKSKSTIITLETDYQRVIPPILRAGINFHDENNNLILEANENALITLTIKNEGKGVAQGLSITIIDSINDPALQIGDVQPIPYLLPGKTEQIIIPIEAGMKLKRAKHKFTIEVQEHFGYDMDPAFLYVQTIEFQEPEIVFSGLGIVDVGEGTLSYYEDGKVQLGEQVKVKITIQNIGHNIARNTRYLVRSKDENVYVTNGEGTLGDLGIGEVKEFWVTVSPNKRFKGQQTLPLFLTLTNQLKLGELTDHMLPLKLDQLPSEPIVLDVKADIDELFKDIARFDVNPNQMKANLGNIINIEVIPPSKTTRSDAVAVVIGVENYENFASAPYAEKDADLMREYFKTVLGVEKVFLYKSDQVTGFFYQEIFNPIWGDLQKQIIEDQTDLFIFYSGHGIPSKDGDKVYLLPADGRLEAIDTQGLDLNVFYEYLLNLKARSITLFIDACFSGISRSSEMVDPENLIAMKSVAFKPTILQPWNDHPQFTIFSSSNIDQISLAYDDSGTGLFTYFLCAGLQGKADLNGDKQITSGELGQYVSEKVKEASVKIRDLQEPQFHGNPDIILTEF